MKARTPKELLWKALGLQSRGLHQKKPEADLLEVDPRWRESFFGEPWSKTTVFA